MKYLNDTGKNDLIMPDKWNSTMLKTSGAPLISRMQQIKEFMPIVSHYGKVEITGSAWAKTYYLTVPKTKKDGAVYLENKTLQYRKGCQGIVEVGRKGKGGYTDG